MSDAEMLKKAAELLRPRSYTVGGTEGRIANELESLAARLPELEHAAKYWEDEARWCASNADFWRERCGTISGELAAMQEQPK